MEQNTEKTVKPGKKVKPDSKTKITWLEADKFHKTGTQSEVHPVQAEKLIASGQAKKYETGDEKMQEAKPKSKTDKV